jgi:enamine deaminase RidA (YjgF/YER057c/UK114 family)
MTLTILQPADWPRPKGYANGIGGTGKLVLIAGQIGWDAQGRFPPDFLGQVRQALQNILAVLAEAGGGPADIARMTWYVTDIEDYRTQAPALGPIWRDVMGKNFPAMAVIGCTALVETEAKVEITAEAFVA